MTITSSDRARRFLVSAASPRPGWLTSPSTTSTRSRRIFREALAVAFRETLEYGRFFDHALQPLQGSSRAIVPHQQEDAADVRKISQQIRQPHFADEARGANQQNILAAQSFAHRKRRASIARFEVHYRNAGVRLGPPGGLNRIIEHFRVFLEAKHLDQLFARKAAVRLAFGEARERAARANHGIEQAARGDALAKIQAIGNEARDAQMLRKRTHDVVQALAHQNNFAARRHRFVQFGYAARFQSRLQKIFEEFLAEQVQAVAAHSSQHCVKKPRGEDAIGDVEKGPRDGERGHRAAARPALQETLRIPREEPHRADGREIQQTAFHAPEDGFARGRRSVSFAPANFRNLDV